MTALPRIEEIAQIALDVETESNGLFRFRHGTLYPILHRLEEDALIHGSWARGDGGRRRKEYTLTEKGRRHLHGETDRVQAVVDRLFRIVRPAGELPA